MPPCPPGAVCGVSSCLAASLQQQRQQQQRSMVPRAGPRSAPRHGRVKPKASMLTHAEGNTYQNACIAIAIALQLRNISTDTIFTRPPL